MRKTHYIHKITKEMYQVETQRCNNYLTVNWFIIDEQGNCVEIKEDKIPNKNDLQTITYSQFILTRKPNTAQSNLTARTQSGYKIHNGNIQYAGYNI